MGGGWMPNKQIVTIEEVFEAKRVLARTLRDFREFPCESTLTLLIIRLFEAIQLVCSYEEKRCANYKSVKNKIFSKVPTAFTNMRNSLVHEMKNINDFNKFVSDNLEDYGKKAFNCVYELCFDRKYDLYSEVMEFLKKFEMSDINGEDKGLVNSSSHFKSKELNVF